MFTAGLWIGNENMAAIFGDFLQMGASVLKPPCADRSPKTLLVEDTLDLLVRIWVVFSIDGQGLDTRTV